ncbi:MAG TPA: hypothetical protein VI461_17410 [Chitinophagaceae bacterium]|nr:hypothetical protein [Chitinophagaceae bacterium]
MLLLFAFSITPKQLLHDAIAGHKHDYSPLSRESNFKVPKNSFQCNWQEQAIESPFTYERAFQAPEAPVFLSFYKSHYTRNLYSAEAHYSSLRGPPSV